MEEEYDEVWLRSMMRREDLGVDLHCTDVREAAHVRQLHHDRVAHQQRWDQRAVGLVERVVEGAEVEHHANGRALDLREDAALLHEAVVARDHRLVRLDRVLDEVHCAVELLRQHTHTAS